MTRYSVVSVATGELLYETSKDMRAFGGCFSEQEERSGIPLTETPRRAGGDLAG